MSNSIGAAYAGDISPAEAWELLSAAAPCALVDVRTKPEWTYVGLPNLAAVQRSPILLEWQVYPDMQVAPDFVASLGARLETAGQDRGAPVLFLCRSGVRSRAAAIAVTAAGWSRCYNVAGGFEGPPDGSGHRGGLEGWKASGLPWTQN
jgi:rhodanese-related sulfurtransferase